MAEKGILFDMEKCIACRACQVACKQWNELPAEKTTFFAATGGYQNPIGLSPKTYTLVKFYEVTKNNQLRWLFRVHRCMHCVDPACVKACPVEPKAMTHVKELGIVYVNKELCIGCGACHEYCPWNIPQIDDEAGKSTKKGRNPVIYGEKELQTGAHKIYVLPEPLDFYPDLPKSPKVSEDIGLFRELLKPLGKLALTASLVGMVIGKVKQTKEKQEV